MSQDIYYTTSKFNCFSNRWNFIAQFLDVDKWWLFFCHTTISGATTNTSTSTIPDIQIQMIQYKKKDVLYFDLKSHPEVLTQVSEAVDWKPAISGIKRLNMNVF